MIGARFDDIMRYSGELATIHDMQRADFIIIGGGIAGASAGALLSAHGCVLLLEAEAQPGYHSTGRSAAYFAPAYGNEVVRNLTAPGATFFRTPPDGFSETPLLHDRAALFVAREDQRNAIENMAAEDASLQRFDIDQMTATVSILKPDIVTAGLYDPSGGDLDVDAILQGYLRQFRSQGGELVTGTPAAALAHRNGLWVINGEYAAPVVVNAAGAWADAVASIAGVEPIGLVPKRRTALLVDAPANEHISDWPLVIGIDEDFYFKPDAGKILISPADETPSNPCDAQPEEIDVAIAIDRVQAIADLEVNRVEHRWAGLRTFAPDKSFVVGFDPRAEGFFWLAGQGGYGVQSAPGVSALACHLLTGNAVPDEHQRILASIDGVRPERLLQ